MIFIQFNCQYILSKERFFENSRNYTQMNDLVPAPLQHFQPAPAVVTPISRPIPISKFVSGTRLAQRYGGPSPVPTKPQIQQTSQQVLNLCNRPSTTQSFARSNSHFNLRNSNNFFPNVQNKAALKNTEKESPIMEESLFFTTEMFLKADHLDSNKKAKMCCSENCDDITDSPPLDLPLNNQSNATQQNVQSRCIPSSQKSIIEQSKSLLVNQNVGMEPHIPKIVPQSNSFSVIRKNKLCLSNDSSNDESTSTELTNIPPNIKIDTGDELHKDGAVPNGLLKKKSSKKYRRISLNGRTYVTQQERYDSNMRAIVGGLECLRGRVSHFDKLKNIKKESNSFNWTSSMTSFYMNSVLE
ncbi:hypothetical protein TRFO_42904 [Tritrichomonas foetus]|uniref:Uncharacterized protein n=1 Tax=Tritrichomonas foetus TaxID=1144522 RepID=A0A1J4KTS7_9EUKA|nr:hypothetical protein TRFO_42904 [Tritrichomonas foetus]|eukprot:OHT14663.1 hypothetical protein TRFO_42904 [Tritrichomonas foetus]